MDHGVIILLHRMRVIGWARLELVELMLMSRAHGQDFAHIIETVLLTVVSPGGLEAEGGLIAVLDGPPPLLFRNVVSLLAFQTIGCPEHAFPQVEVPAVERYRVLILGNAIRIRLTIEGIVDQLQHVLCVKAGHRWLGSSSDGRSGGTATMRRAAAAGQCGGLPHRFINPPRYLEAWGLYWLNSMW